MSTALVKRRVSFVICILFFAGILLPSVYILLNANHIDEDNKIGQTCATCANMAGAAKIIKVVSIIIAGCVLVFGGTIVFLPSFRAGGVVVIFNSLILLKVRLNN